jgi:ankyrin repeat protein
VEAGKIVSILNSKGFQAHRNTKLMHRILSWQSLVTFLQEHEDIEVTDEAGNIHPAFTEWLRQMTNKGIDGEILMKLLADRCLDLQHDNLWLAQKISFNEFGSVMYPDRHSTVARLLDFWIACRYGYLQDVIIYCKCGAPVNEEKIDRQTGERFRPLASAAMGGHADVIKVLLDYGAEVNHVDRRGRRAIHIAALKGHREACAVLIDHGAKIFSVDLQGNTPLHLAALCNHYTVVDYLASKGQELARLICSDKVKCNVNGNFASLVEKIFHDLPEQKLEANDTVRFEKTWLHEAAVLFKKWTDANVQYMLPRSCQEIMEDVCRRFDPRPESGIFITHPATTENIFIKTIATPKDLGILLHYIFRQAAVDSINRWHRTALHVACDANIINSHEKIIFRLMDDYGCNLQLKDSHQRTAMDLLILDKIVPNAPTSTKVREEVVNSKRQVLLNEMFAAIEERERERRQELQRQILLTCIEREKKMESRLWESCRNASVMTLSIVGHDFIEHPPPTFPPPIGAPGGASSEAIDSGAGAGAGAADNVHSLEVHNTIPSSTVAVAVAVGAGKITTNKALFKVVNYHWKRINWEIYEDFDTKNFFFTRAPTLSADLVTISNTAESDDRNNNNNNNNQQQSNNRSHYPKGDNDNDHDDDDDDDDDNENDDDMTTATITTTVTAPANIMPSEQFSHRLYNFHQPHNHYSPNRENSNHNHSSQSHHRYLSYNPSNIDGFGFEAKGEEEQDIFDHSTLTTTTTTTTTSHYLPSKSLFPETTIPLSSLTTTEIQQHSHSSFENHHLHQLPRELIESQEDHHVTKKQPKIIPSIEFKSIPSHKKSTTSATNTNNHTNNNNISVQSSTPHTLSSVKEQPSTDKSSSVINNNNNNNIINNQQTKSIKSSLSSINNSNQIHYNNNNNNNNHTHSNQPNKPQQQQQHSSNLNNQPKTRPLHHNETTTNNRINNNNNNSNNNNNNNKMKVGALRLKIRKDTKQQQIQQHQKHQLQPLQQPLAFHHLPNHQPTHTQLSQKLRTKSANVTTTSSHLPITHHHHHHHPNNQHHQQQQQHQQQHPSSMRKGRFMEVVTGSEGKSQREVHTAPAIPSSSYQSSLSHPQESSMNNTGLMTPTIISQSVHIPSSSSTSYLGAHHINNNHNNNNNHQDQQVSKGYSQNSSSSENSNNNHHNQMKPRKRIVNHHVVPLSSQHKISPPSLLGT